MFSKSEPSTAFRRVRRPSAASRGAWTRRLWLCLALAALSTAAHASMFQGEQLDKLAEILSWVVLVVAPIAAIAIFLIIHILPEKIAERNGHPQAAAIKTLCLLSLVFGGILWPLAWLWAFTKPVFHKMAYGTDVEFHGSHAAETEAKPEAVAVVAPTPPSPSELELLRRRIDELEAMIANSPTQGGRA